MEDFTDYIGLQMRYISSHAIIAPSFDTTETTKEPFIKRFLASLVVVLKKVGITLIAALLCVVLSLGASYLDKFYGTGNGFQMLSYCISLLIGIITSYIVFE